MDTTDPLDDFTLIALNACIDALDIQTKHIAALQAELELAYAEIALLETAND